jgi:hypothetical protein
MPCPAAIKQGRRPVEFFDAAATPQRGTTLSKFRVVIDDRILDRDQSRHANLPAPFFASN